MNFTTRQFMITSKLMLRGDIGFFVYFTALGDILRIQFPVKI